ncbi:unnamed protein product [Caenorhabditis brenneri]
MVFTGSSSRKPPAVARGHASGVSYLPTLVKACFLAALGKPPYSSVFLVGLAIVSIGESSRSRRRRLEMEVSHENEAAKILSLVDPNFLKSITIHKDRNSRNMSKLKINELEVLEQWKNAENLEFWGFELDEKGVESLVGQFSMVKLNAEVVIMDGSVI